MEGRIARIFILLGNGCNMRCRYCVQRPMNNGMLSEEVSPAFLRWLNAQAGNAPMVITFFGGEPLLYFSQIKKIMENAVGAQVYWNVITNGKALTDSMVEFFNARQMHVTLSWDGRATKQTRGLDVLRCGAPLRHRILRLRHLCLCGVLSGVTYPKALADDAEIVEKAYFAVSRGRLRLYMEPLMDFDISDEEITSINTERMKEETAELCRQYRQWTEGSGQESPGIRWVEAKGATLLGKMKRGEKLTSECGNGIRVVNVDLEGNVYECHNNQRKIGTVKTENGDILREILRADMPVLLRRMSGCRHCFAYALCGGGCRYLSDENLKRYCQIRQAVDGTIVEFLKGWAYENS